MDTAQRPPTEQQLEGSTSGFKLGLSLEQLEELYNRDPDTGKHRAFYGKVARRAANPSLNTITNKSDFADPNFRDQEGRQYKIRAQTGSRLELDYMIPVKVRQALEKERQPVHPTSDILLELYPIGVSAGSRRLVAKVIGFLQTVQGQKALRRATGQVAVYIEH